MGAAVTMDTLKMFNQDWLLLSDFIDFFCGDCIGSGESRNVYEFRYNPKLVVKIDASNGKFFNIREWEVWDQIKDLYPKQATFLAPCMSISNAGKIMLQRKTTPIISYNKLPKKIPYFLADTKVSNWGMLDGRAVCHDYANHNFYEVPGSMKIPYWHTELDALKKKD